MLEDSSLGHHAGLGQYVHSVFDKNFLFIRFQRSGGTASIQRTLSYCSFPEGREHLYMINK